MYFLTNSITCFRSFLMWENWICLHCALLYRVWMSHFIYISGASEYWISHVLIILSFRLVLLIVSALVHPQNAFYKLIECSPSCHINRFRRSGVVAFEIVTLRLCWNDLRIVRQHSSNTMWHKIKFYGSTIRRCFSQL